MGTITLSRMVSVTVGFGGLKTSLEGEWDEFWYSRLVSCVSLKGIWRLIWSCAYGGGDGRIVTIKTLHAGNVPLR